MNIKNLSLVIAMAATILLSSCGDDKKKSSKSTSSDDSKKSEKSDGENSPSFKSEEALYGRWILESIDDEKLPFDGNYVVFEKDGTGEVNIAFNYSKMAWKVDNKSLCTTSSNNFKTCGSFLIEGDQLTWNPINQNDEKTNLKFRKAPNSTEAEAPEMGMFEESATPEMDMYSDYDESATEAIAPAEDMYGDMPLEMMEAEEMDIESLDGY